MTTKKNKKISLNFFCLLFIDKRLLLLSICGNAHIYIYGLNSPVVTFSANRCTEMAALELLLWPYYKRKYFYEMSYQFSFSVRVRKYIYILPDVLLSRLKLESNLRYFWFDWKLNFQEPLLLYSPTPTATATATAPATPTPTPTPLC